MTDEIYWEYEVQTTTYRIYRTADSFLRYEVRRFSPTTGSDYYVTSTTTLWGARHEIKRRQRENQKRLIEEIEI